MLFSPSPCPNAIAAPSPRSAEASHARTLSCRGHARCSQALAIAQARPLQPHDHALPTWLAGAPPLRSLHGDGGRLKKKLTCGAHTSMSGKREVVGVKRSFDLFYRGFQARCHAGMPTWHATSAKVGKRRRFTVCDSNCVEAHTKPANEGVPSVRMAKS